jgi:hypothetical protein
LIVICSTGMMVTPHQYAGDNAKLDGEYEILTEEEV